MGPSFFSAYRACAPKYTFLPKTLTFLPVFFGLRGHRQLRPGRGGGEAGVFYSLILYLVPCTYFYLVTLFQGRVRLVFFILYYFILYLVLCTYFYLVFNGKALCPGIEAGDFELKKTYYIFLVTN